MFSNHQIYMPVHKDPAAKSITELRYLKPNLRTCVQYLRFVVDLAPRYYFQAVCLYI